MPVTRSARTSASPVSKPVLHNSFRRSRTLSAEFEVAKDAELSLPLHTAFVYTRMSLLHREPGGSPLEDDSVLEHLLGTGEATHERFSASARTHGNQMPHPKLTRGLKERHIRMISIAGMIGTGLFLSSGQALASAGPIGALLGYSVMGLVTCAVAYTSAEMSAFMPVSGGFVRHVANFVDPTLGAVVGWNFWYAIAVTQAVEIVAATIIVSYWRSPLPSAMWITIFWLGIIAINLGPVRYYGEAEFTFALLKIALIIILIVGGLVVELGGAPNHDRIGFRYWINPGPFRELEYGDNVIYGAKGRFLAVWSTLVNAAFAFGNVQVVSVAGAETIDPRRSIPTAVKRTFARVFFFYILSILVMGLILPSNDPTLRGGNGTVSQAPFVIAFKRAGINTLTSAVNAIIMSSAFSSGVSCAFISSRTLLGLADDGLAPGLLRRTNSFGTPYYAVLISASLGALAYLSVSNETLQVLVWLVNLSAVAGLVSWVFLSFAYIRFYTAMRVQGYSRDNLLYKSPLQPYAAWFALVGCILIVLFSGFTVFLGKEFSVSAFLSNYINVFIFIGVYTISKIASRSTTLFIPAREVDLSEFETIAAERIASQSVGSSLPKQSSGTRVWRRFIDNVF